MSNTSANDRQGVTFRTCSLCERDFPSDALTDEGLCDACDHYARQAVREEAALVAAENYLPGDPIEILPEVCRDCAAHDRFGRPCGGNAVSCAESAEEEAMDLARIPSAPVYSYSEEELEEMGEIVLDRALVDTLTPEKLMLIAEEVAYDGPERPPEDGELEEDQLEVYAAWHLQQILDDEAVQLRKKRGADMSDPWVRLRVATGTAERG